MALLRPSVDRSIQQLLSYARNYSARQDNAFQELLLERRELYANDLSLYIRDSWEYSNTGDPLQWNWHIDAIADHLMACFHNEINYLIINIPPRMAKSTHVGIQFPSWCWGIDPRLRFLCVSYASELAMRDNFAMQQLIKSPWYQELYSDVFQLTIENKRRTQNNKGGARISTGILGTLTGEGAGILLIDDGNSMGDIHSETIRNKTNEKFDQVLSSRLNNLLKSCIINIQQRAHHEDLTGHILSKEFDNVVHLYLPMEFESARKCITVPLNGSDEPWEDPRTVEGEILAPRMFPPEKINFLKRSLGSYAYSGNYQQAPSPDEGGIFKRDWFRLWKYRHLPAIEFVVQCWDTALSTEPTAAYSACTTWGVFKDEHNVPQLMLLKSWYARREWTELRQMMIRLARNWDDTQEHEEPLEYKDPPDIILVEAKANGLSLIQSLRRAGIDVTPYTPPRKQRWGAVDYSTTNGKVQRARLVSPLVESGRIWLPTVGPSFTNLFSYADDFREACANFPNTIESKDLVDTFTQAVEWLNRHEWIYAKDDVLTNFDETYIDEDRFKPSYKC